MSRDTLVELMRILGGIGENTLVWSPDRQPITVAELAALYRTDGIPGWRHVIGRFGVTTVFVPTRASEPDAPLWETGLWVDGQLQTIAFRHKTRAEAEASHGRSVANVHIALVKHAAGAYDQLAPFTCGTCGATSHHPMDSQTGYCGRCHAFTRDIV